MIRRNYNVAAVAQANKMTRIVWALLVHNGVYQKFSLIPTPSGDRVALVGSELKAHNNP